MTDKSDDLHHWCLYGGGRDLNLTGPMTSTYTMKCTHTHTLNECNSNLKYMSVHSISSRILIRI